jgi:alpha-aminoadipate/glutamate carrier protein LysW
MYAALAECPVCRQRLAVQSYVVIGTAVVCNGCRSTLKIVSVKPLKFEKVDVAKTYNADSRPESYG